MLSSHLISLSLILAPFVRPAPIPVPQPQFDLGSIGDAAGDFFGFGGDDEDAAAVDNSAAAAEEEEADDGGFDFGNVLETAGNAVGDFFGGGDDDDDDAAADGEAAAAADEDDGFDFGDIADAVGDIFGAEGEGGNTTLFGVSLEEIKDTVGDLGRDAIDGFLDGDGDLPTSSEAPTALAAADVSSRLLRPAQFTQVSYCSSPVVQDLSCGAPCDALGPNVEVLLAGGDDGLIPNFFVAHDADTNSIVVAHQGTDFGNILSILNNVEFFLTDIDEARFTSAQGLNAEVHSGFQRTFERAADDILAAVQDGLASTGATNVLVTGHSLGGALATLDGLFLQQELGATATVTTVTFGAPRVGNQAFADLIESSLGASYTRVTNKDDVVPVVPPRFLDFQQASGEIHIDQDGSALECGGQENESCAQANSVLDTSAADHAGPYVDGVSFGGEFCSL